MPLSPQRATPRGGGGINQPLPVCSAPPYQECVHSQHPLRKWRAAAAETRRRRRKRAAERKHHDAQLGRYLEETDVSADKEQKQASFSSPQRPKAKVTQTKFSSSTRSSWLQPPTKVELVFCFFCLQSVSCRSPLCQQKP